MKASANKINNFSSTATKLQLFTIICPKSCFNLNRLQWLNTTEVLSILLFSIFYTLLARILLTTNKPILSLALWTTYVRNRRQKCQHVPNLQVSCFNTDSNVYSTRSSSFRRKWIQIKISKVRMMHGTNRRYSLRWIVHEHFLFTTATQDKLTFTMWINVKNKVY